MKNFTARKRALNYILIISGNPLLQILESPMREICDNLTRAVKEIQSVRSEVEGTGEDCSSVHQQQISQDSADCRASQAAAFVGS